MVCVCVCNIWVLKNITFTKNHLQFKIDIYYHHCAAINFLGWISSNFNILLCQHMFWNMFLIAYITVSCIFFCCIFGVWSTKQKKLGLAYEGAASYHCLPALFHCCPGLCVLICVVCMCQVCVRVWYLHSKKETAK